MTSEVGNSLREARTSRGIELVDVERVIKIRAKYLRAMEEGRWELLPAPAYARGFLSTYSRFLGLDDRALIEQFTRETEAGDEPDAIPETMLPQEGMRKRHPWRRVIAIAAALLAGALLTLLVAGLPGSDDARDRNSRPESAGDPPAAGTQADTDTTSEPETTTTPAPSPLDRTGGVSVVLQSTGTVWVCLVSDRGRALVNGETLTADEERGPFEARAFDVTFGNGSVQMTVDDEPVEIPTAAEPLGYRIDGGGAEELDPAARPTCT
jgi:cytoskeleton protein RodZ